MASFGAVTLKILRTGSEATIPAWYRRPKSSIRQIAGADVEVVQFLGFEAQTIEWPVDIVSAADLAALQALVGTLATLVDTAGTSYPNTLLEDVTNVAVSPDLTATATIKLRRG